MRNQSAHINYSKEGLSARWLQVYQRLPTLAGHKAASCQAEDFGLQGVSSKRPRLSDKGPSRRYLLWQEGVPLR